MDASAQVQRAGLRLKGFALISIANDRQMALCHARHQGKRAHQAAEILLRPQGSDSSNNRAHIARPARFGRGGAKAGQVNAVGDVVQVLPGQSPNVGGNCQQVARWQDNRAAPQQQPPEPDPTRDLLYPLIGAEPVFNMDVAHQFRRVGQNPFKAAEIAGDQHIRIGCAQIAPKNTAIHQGVTLVEGDRRIVDAHSRGDTLATGNIAVQGNDAMAKAISEVTGDAGKTCLRAASRLPSLAIVIQKY